MGYCPNKPCLKVKVSSLSQVIIKLSVRGAPLTTYSHECDSAPTIPTALREASRPPPFGTEYLPPQTQQVPLIDKSVGPSKVRIKKLEKERATMAFADVLPRAELNTPPETHSVKRSADSDSGKLQNFTIIKQPQGNSVSPPGEQVNPSFSDKAELSAPVSGRSRRIPVANTEASTSEKKSRVTSNEAPARVVAAMSQSCGKAPAGPQEDIIVASQSNVALEHNAQHPLINVITQSDSQQAAAAANKRGTTRSRSPNRRVTRAMSVSQHPRINVFPMKCAATIQISPEPTRKICTYLCATSRTTSLTSRTQRHQGMPPVNPEVRTNTGRQDDSSAPMHVSSGSFPTALPECAQRRKPADHVRKHPLPFHRYTIQAATSYIKSYPIHGDRRHNSAKSAQSTEKTSRGFLVFVYRRANNSLQLLCFRQSPPSSPMSSPSRKKRPKDPDSPTTDKPNDQVQFSPGRHTDVAHEDELVLAADGPKKPLRDTPASSLATAAVAPASFETTSTASIPVSTPVNNSGHPSAVSSSSQISTHDAETAAQRLISQWEDDYDIEVDVSDQEEENPPPPPEEEPEETYAPESDFAVPTIIHGAQVPASSQKVPTANTVRQVSTSFITAQVPIRANGHPCHALIDTGANITVTSEATKETFCDTPLEPPKSSTALGLGGNAVNMVGAAVIKFQIGPFKVDHLTHFTEGRCTPAGPTDYTFIIGNDVLSQLPKFVFDYANARFYIGGAILPMGNQQERDSRPGNYRLYLGENTTFPAESEQRVKGTLNKKLTNHDMVVHQQSDLFDRLGLSITPTVFRSQNALLLVTNPTRTDITVPARATIANVGRIHTAPDGSLHCSDTASDEAFPNIATTDSRLQPLDPDFKIDFNSIQCKEEERRQLKKLCEDYADVLSRNPYDLGSSKTEPVHIYTTSEVPVKSRPYRVPVKYQAELEQHINALIRSERITESNTPWTSPIVLVKKKSGALRVCLDFRRLNDITIPDNFPLPRIDAILEKVGGARYFSSLDMANGYLQLRLDAESSYKCGFITETKVFAYTHLPFGLKSAASYFQRALKTVLANMDRDVLVYIDDILIYSQDFGQHIATLRNVFERFRQFNLKVSPKKCEFLKKAITFLGHTITESNYTPNEANVKSIAEMSTPKNLAETRRFVGMVGFFRKFLPNLATVAEPLTRLNRKNEKFRWETPQQEAFDTLREALLDKPILAFPDYEKPFHLFCDASAVGLGAALMQAETEEEKHFKAIAYTSRTLADSETRWPAIQVELLAIIFALRHFRPYICLSKIILHSDHRPLSYLLSKHKVNDNLARWLIELQQYDIKIVHIDGKKNTVADYLSRMQGESQPKETELEDIVSFPVCMANTTYEHVPPTVLRISGMNSIDINEEQRKDPVLASVRALVEKRPTPCIDLPNEWKHHLKFVKISTRGTLVINFPGTPGLVEDKTIVPEALRELVITGHHASLLGGGHFHWRPTMHKTQKKFFWPGMRTSIIQHCLRCQQCQLRRSKPPTQREQQLVVPTNYVFQRVGIDLTGPLPVTAQGNRYYMNAICWFTRYVISIPLPDTRADTCARALLNHVVLKYGAMSELISDGASGFTSAAFEHFCALLEIQHHTAIPHHSRGNGSTERTFRTFHNSMAKYVNNKHNDWEDHLQAVAFAYNTAQHSTTGESPFYLMYGRDPVFPIEKIIHPEPGNDATQDPHEWKHHLTTTIQQAWRDAADHTEIAQGRYNNTANLGARPIEVKPGDLVVMKNFKSKVGLSRKLVMPWEGLYRITSLERPFAYIVECRRPTKPPRKVHLDQIKKFLETSTSTRPSHQQVDLPPAQLPPIAPSATPMRTSSNIAAGPSQNGPESRAVPSSRQSPPPPLVTGTAVNHDDIPYGLRRTRRKPTRYRD
uniref:RNA-directed DNA polymerase n=1 Tax=Caenorhabditis japonica TaxID=281687 RepID=A0A8R1IXM4_CAEJA